MDVPVAAPLAGLLVAPPARPPAPPGSGLEKSGLDPGVTGPAGGSAARQHREPEADRVSDGEQDCSLRGLVKRAVQLLQNRNTKNDMNTTPGSTSSSPLTEAIRSLVKPFRFPTQPHQYKVVPLRECPTPDAMALCDTPDRAADYWRNHVSNDTTYNPECECMVVLMLNTRRRVRGHYLVATGTIDTLLVHPREVFRIAIMVNATAIVLMHNHPSGESSPSEADIRVTRELIRAGQLLKLEVVDHVIIGNPTRSSLREMGYFYS